MQFIIGLVALFACVLGSFSVHGDLKVLWQPLEFVIIFGAGVAAFLIGNPSFIVKEASKSLKYVFKGKPFAKKDYIELLMFLNEILKLMKTKGVLQAEAHIENPKDSEIFKKYPSVTKSHHCLEFFCDSVRLLTIGVDNQYVMGDILDQELDIHHHECEMIGSSVVTFGDSLPALGIVAAVLGVIVTMGSISEPPEILGGLIGAALVGTFAGILLSYGIFSPMGNFIKSYFVAESEYLKAMKTAIISFMQGNAPVIVVEFVRKSIPPHLRPSFAEVDKAINNAGGGAAANG